MAGRSIHNNPQDPKSERFKMLEAQVTDINRNMNLLMASLISDLRPFGDDGDFNLEIRP
jgi:hypothetical protein